MPYIFPAEKHPALRLPGTTGLGLRPSLACSEGIRLSCGQNNRTLLDKMFDLLIGLNLTEGLDFVADKYYCSGRFMKQLVGQNIHLVTMMKRGAVAYFTPTESTEKRRGRPAKYGAKIKLFDLLYPLKLPG